jgi:DNA-binding GntR family transcriptional regulator
VIVHEPSKSELLEVYEMRSVLEPICMSKTVERISEREITGAAALCQEMDKEKEPGGWVILNSQFHAILVAAARSPLLVATVNNLRNRSGIYIAASFRLEPERMLASNAEHMAMVEACRARDVEAMLMPVRAHLRATTELGAIYLQQQDEPGDWS